MADNPLVGTQPAQLPSPQPNTPPPDAIQSSALPQTGTQPPPARSLPFAPPPQVQEAHHNLLGRAFYAIADPQSGTGSPAQRLFKNILAGAMIGAAHGGNSGSGWQAAANGMNAVQANNQRQAEIQRQQQQQKFENDLRMKQEDRAQQSFESEQTYRKAQLELNNIETLRTAMQLQNASYTMHQQAATDDAARVSSYDLSGVKPTFLDIPETDVLQYKMEHPGLDWRVTGVKTVDDGKGHPYYVSTYSAYNPKSEMKIAPATIQQWDKDGLFKFHPEYKEWVTNHQNNLSWDQFNHLDRMAQGYSSTTRAQQLQDLDVEEKKARIQEAKASVSKDAEELNNAKLEGQLKQRAIDQITNQQAALKTIDENGGDISKVTDPKQRRALSDYATGQIDDLYKQYHELDDVEKSSPTGEGSRILNNINSWRKWQIASARDGGGSDPNTAGLSSDAAQAFSDATAAAPDFSSAKLGVANIPDTKLSDADRSALLKALEKYYANKEAEDARTKRRVAEEKRKQTSAIEVLPAFLTHPQFR
jgi:hypothetical protein